MPVSASKRLYTQSASECLNEPIQVTTVVVIHPGSYNLRIGRASDTFPITIPHCLARLKKDPGDRGYQSAWVVRPEAQHPEVKQQQKNGLKTAMEAIQSKPLDTGESRPTTSAKQLFATNFSIKGEKTDVLSQQRWTNTERQPPYMIGEEALFLHPSSSEYSIHWPIRRGHLNIHDGPGGSLSAIMADLEVLWGTAIQSLLGIPLKDLMHYKALLLIPDVYIHKHVKELMNLLLDRLGFGAAIVHQESVCALYGSGVPSACIVDVGDQKTSVCCVEDGISHKQTRITMEYGGSDATHAFVSLLARIGFSPPEIDMSRTLDVLLMQELKETLCHLDHSRYGLLDHSIQIRRPQKHIVKYSVRLGDELLLGALSLFFPDMFGLQGSHLTRIQPKYDGDPDDPHDKFYLKQMQSRQEQAAKSSKKKENTESARDESNMAADDSQLNILQDEDSNEAPDTLPSVDSSKLSKGGRNEVEEEEEEEAEPFAQLMGIDQAILESINRCGSDETKKKMYSCIVVVGGGAMFNGAQPWLQYRVWVGMPPQFRLMLETMDVITKPKEMDPQFVCWKGAAVLACLDSTQELWIRQKEWKQFSVRLLRERAPFVW